MVVSPEAQAQLVDVCRRARVAARRLAPEGRAIKDAVLVDLSASLRAEAARGVESDVLRANANDLAQARAAGVDAALIDRLSLDPGRLIGMADAVDTIAKLDDPVGAVIGMTRRPNGLLIGRVRIPLGVIAMIYESRPNVTVDAAALALKSGNAVLLRGGKEAARSNAALGKLVRDSLAKVGLREDAVQILPSGPREEIAALVQLAGKIDLVIPRGGAGLIQFVTEHARVPVIQHYQGVCHLYVDNGADLEMAERLIENSKARVSVCNALECLLVHEDVARALLPRLSRLVSAGLELRGDEATRKHLPAAKAAEPGDYGREFLANILAVRVVGSFEEALDHIATYGSNHTEAICTRDYARSQRFLREVDASCVLVNASTRFNDGGELGLGAEMGISTTKLHAYGPMGVEHLTTMKWIAYGDGQVR
jgi:glutamate-5-semialdehyde dehydrogenase